MISESPSLFSSLLSETQPIGVKSFLERAPADVTFYGTGKAALYDGLSGLVEPGENVLIPAYLPDAVGEPFHDLGLEIRQYRLQENLAPNLADIERRLDEETIAAMSVNYFGFPQPELEEFVTLVGEYDCYHIDDNAHAPLSVDKRVLLGTRGHLGITSLWKLLPIPNGAVLYRNDNAVAEGDTPSSFAGVRDRFGITDCSFIFKSVITDLLDTNAVIRRSIETLIAGASPSIPDPSVRYEAGKTPMSKLSASIAEDADPTAIRTARRDNYLAWQRILETRDDLDILYESLPEGICPQVFPIRTSVPQQLLAELERCGVGGSHTWPRLPGTVRENPEYETATRLAQELIILPVHQHIEPSSIEAVGDNLQR